MPLDRRFRLPRLWSNAELRRLGTVFGGRVINVSGWQDSDKEGGRYRSYFPNAVEYRISNYRGERGFQGEQGEIELDLTAPLPEALHGRFDVVFNHTTLEHVFDVHAAVAALCGLSSDVVIVVVPVAQPQHETGSWKDYWRFTPPAMRELFAREGLTVVYEAVNRHWNAGIYLISVASRHPERWRSKLPAWKPIEDAAQSLGRSFRPGIFGAARRLIGVFQGREGALRDRIGG